jgi:hypothetical protein
VRAAGAVRVSPGVSPPGPRLRLLLLLLLLLLQSEPWRVYKGHSMAVTALSWSRSQLSCC